MSPRYQIDDVPGRPTRYITARNFDLGKNGMKLQRGMELEYDGLNLTLPGYPRVAMPEIRGAIKAGWVVPLEHFDPNDFSAMEKQPAGVRVSRADGGNPMNPKPRQAIDTQNVEREEREVGNVNRHASNTRANNRENYRAQANFRQGTNNTSMSVQDQEGIPVRSVSTPANQRTVFDHNTLGEHLRQAKSVQVEPGVGLSREEMLDRMSADERAEYEATVRAHRRIVDEDEPVVVGRIPSQPKTTEREGFKVSSSVGGGVDTFDAGGSSAPAQTSVIESEGMMFRTTNGPKKNVQTVQTQVSKASEDIRRRNAKRQCPDFPDLYNFDDSERKKIARIQADFEDRPDIINAIFSAENDSMKERLLQEFPSAFEGD